MKNLITSLSVLIAFVGSIFSIYFYVDSKYAYAEAVKKLETRVTVSELQVVLIDALKDYYFYKDAAKKYPKDQEIQDKLKESSDTVKDIKDQIADLKKQK